MKAVDRLMSKALAEAVFPGAVLLVSHKGAVQLHKAYGMANIFAQRAVALDTVFDLASLTKPLATSLAVMQLVQAHRLDLDQPLGSILASFNTRDKDKIRVVHLLSHTAGLPDYRPYYQTLVDFPPAQRKAELHRRLAAEPLQSVPGSRVRYSDLGFMVLQWIAEAITQTRLDVLVSRSVYQPLDLGRLFFIDLDRPRPEANYAATEHCPWRNSLIEGAVHDENTYALGGVGGHAGLFGDAATVHRLLTVLLAAYKGDGTRSCLAPAIVRRFFERYQGLPMALGFDVPAAADSSAGKYFSKNSVGHLGFTGTSFWIDLDRDIIVVLLTNRVHPSRDNDKLKPFRPLLHDTVMQAL